ncbi:hypothetical protein IEQ34_014828 [Dendrobium chrysotoxum]|uniref:Uncharacterized protein n=1 Tax=Dendrobium chrysotoxum TaxID=161865 RepID=A0AAV7GL97_DENCH|nr:hypothetical protein IEQ34_014828 [Dendrobium chrysotoxum]
MQRTRRTSHTMRKEASDMKISLYSSSSQPVDFGTVCDHVKQMGGAKMKTPVWLSTTFAFSLWIKGAEAARRSARRASLYSTSFLASGSTSLTASSEQKLSVHSTNRGVFVLSRMFIPVMISIAFSKLRQEPKVMSTKLMVSPPKKLFPLLHLTKVSSNCNSAANSSSVASAFFSSTPKINARI